MNLVKHAASAVRNFNFKLGLERTIRLGRNVESIQWNCLIANLPIYQKQKQQSLSNVHAVISSRNMKRSNFVLLLLLLLTREPTRTWKATIRHLIFREALGNCDPPLLCLQGSCQCFFNVVSTSRLHKWNFILTKRYTLCHHYYVWARKRSYQR